VHHGRHGSRGSGARPLSPPRIPPPDDRRLPHRPTSHLQFKNLSIDATVNTIRIFFFAGAAPRSSSSRHTPSPLRRVVGASLWQVTDGQMVLRVSNGVPMLRDITATGCTVTAVMAAFVACAAPQQQVAAAAHALAVFGCVHVSLAHRPIVVVVCARLTRGLDPYGR
jgi:hypothetical protein